MEEKENIKDVIAKIKADLAAKVNELEATKISNQSIINKTKTPINKEPVIDNTILKSDFKTKIVDSKQEINSKPIKKRKKISFIPIALILASLLALAYIINLRNNVQKEKDALEELKKRDVNYKKKIIFTDIEDDILDEDLQKIDQFKDIPEDSIH